MRLNFGPPTGILAKSSNHGQRRDFLAVLDDEGVVAKTLADRHEIFGKDRSVDEVVAYLKTGHNNISAASGPMGEVVAASTSQMTDADLTAMAVYLKDRAPLDVRPHQPISDQDPIMRAGQAVYLDNCAACHDAAGTGIPKLFSALKESPSVLADDPISVIRVVLQGAQSVATDAVPTGSSMPAHRWKLSDEQVAAVVAYIRNSWGNAATAVSANDVASARQQFLKLAAGFPEVRSFDNRLNPLWANVLRR